MIKEIEHIIWSYLAIPTLLIVSLIFTFYYRGAQFRFKEMIKCLTKKHQLVRVFHLFNPLLWPSLHE